MRQAALFKHICQNFEEGFVFSGDTAQTVARGVDFRFQDIRSLFYNEFTSEPRNDIKGKPKEKAQCSVSDYFQLSQNFRTHAGILKLSQSVILVRDESDKREVSDQIGKQALVLTLVECKGLEFQDVLLYNFFGTSPLKNQWRVIYGYMEELNLFPSNEQKSFPTFCSAKHKILCSELKQLYVALTRARQRLWVRHLDESLAQTMRIGSSKEEWCSRAARLRATANQMGGSNSELARVHLTEAAMIFETIGKFEIAAKCFIQLKEFERAVLDYLFYFLRKSPTEVNYYKTLQK
ncbi:hypothetical protein MKW94_000317 [Papaver nudicaule]|uniref:UvrD-like helicase C-terminal domain-containing protein n=1 Tax=Papaver nudicaule TaxID=74823 RepID=A0AA41SAK9_PAPNU|nr:hypothetical protein [Papaver nudicaule]